MHKNSLPPRGSGSGGSCKHGGRGDYEGPGTS